MCDGARTEIGRKAGTQPVRKLLYAIAQAYPVTPTRWSPAVCW